ncbi:MAG: U32 family peptidase [Cellulosilyticum sp.]|nr:U32 family peptidase [Cellulosilyticum sp.]
MNVLVPLNNIDHIDDYIEAGAREFYIGFYDEAWWEKFGEYADINRLTGFKKDANPYNFEEVLEIIRQVKQRDVQVYVTFNSSIYNQEQLAYVEGYMQRLKETPLDGVIVSCAELVEVAKKVGLSAVISTIAGIYNSDLTKFYCDLGAKRVILPRDLSIKEIEEIVKKQPNVEYEIFMMRNGCRFSDSNCLGFHRLEKTSICACVGNAGRDLGVKGKGFKEKHEVELNDIVYTQNFHNMTCGICSIYRFVKLGITAGKIVGRSDEWRNICEDIRLIRKNVEIARSCETEEEYLERMIFPNGHETMCKMGLSCYYPEIRF